MKLFIVDANCIGLFFRPGSGCLHQLHNCFIGDLAGKFDLCLAYGGSKLLTEYGRIAIVLPLLVELRRTGKAKLFSNELVDSKAKALMKERKLRSNDGHIIALAQISGARLLVSTDNKLSQDFSNAQLLRPVGKIYRDDNEHWRLLTKARR